VLGAVLAGEVTVEPASREEPDVVDIVGTDEMRTDQAFRGHTDVTAGQQFHSLILLAPSIRRPDTRDRGSFIIGSGGEQGFPIDEVRSVAWCLSCRCAR
jgi:hypothetical protein